MRVPAAADPTAYLRTNDDVNYYVAVTVSSWRLTAGDVKDASGLLNKVKAGTDPLSRYIFGQLGSATFSLIKQYAPSMPPRSRLQKALATDLNTILAVDSFYAKERFAGVILRPETAAMLASDPQGEARRFLHRMLLDDAFPNEITRNSSLPPLWDGRGTDLTPDQVRSQVLVSVYQKGSLIQTTIGPPDIYGSDFTISILDPQVLKDGLGSLQVAVHQYPVAKDKTSGFMAGVATEVVSSLTLNNGNCFEGFPLEVSLDPAVADSAYGVQRLNKLLKYVKGHAPAVLVQAHTWDDTKPWTLRPQFVSFGVPDTDKRFVPCYTLAKDPPTGTFDIRFDYPPDALIELRHPFLKTGVVNAGHIVSPGSLDTGEVGKRAVEQNLDVAVQFGSSVSDKTEKDAAGMDVPVRKRESRGTLDLRLAPWLNVLDLPGPGSRTFKFLTPFLIDARVSTGKVNKDTLSLNRVWFGPQFEIRHYTDPQTYPTYQRYIFSFTNASDRDFKQAEWKVSFEFQPVFSALNRPLSFRSKNFDPKLDPDPNRAQDDIPVKLGLGVQVLPVVGFEAGKTWRNKHPFAAIAQTTFVRRFYFGGTINLDLTSFVQVSVKDFFYVRGETPGDRGRHYFLGSVTVPFPSFTRNSSSSAFFSFERGGQPPFASPDVNSVKLGYRVQWDNWFGKRR
jgi:hypothetical protein